MSSVELNEYHVLVVFCAGMLAHALSVVRSWRQAGWVAALSVVALVAGWFLSEPGDRRFALALGWALVFSIGFAVVFRKQMLPRVTAAAVLHILCLAYYALYLSSREAGVTMPRSIVVVGLAPGVAIGAGALAGMLRFSWFRVTAYVAHLIGLIVVISCQWSLDQAVEIYRSTGFSAELFLFYFLFGGICLALVSYTVQILILLPPLERDHTRKLMDAITGPITYHREQAAMMAARHAGHAVDLLGLGLVVAHGTLLAANARFDWISAPVLIAASLAALMWLIMPWEAQRQMRRRQVAEITETPGE